MIIFPDKFFPYTQINIVQFPSGLGGNDITENTFKRPIQQQLRDALRFIKNNILTEKVKKIPGKAEADRYFNYPYEAIEEALSNAVYHRDYEEREPIEVRIEQDRIEIVSFKGPDRSITQEALKNYRVSNRRYRNRRIGEFLKELHLTEGRNTGFPKIINAIKQNGSPMPEFETNDERSYFISRFYIHKAFLNNTTPKTTPKSAHNLSKKKTTSDDIIKLINNNPKITRTEIADIIGISLNGVKYQIKSLKNKDELNTLGLHVPANGLF